MLRRVIHMLTGAMRRRRSPRGAANPKAAAGHKAVSAAKRKM